MMRYHRKYFFWIPAPLRGISLVLAIAMSFLFLPAQNFSSSANEIFILDLNDVTINPVTADYLIHGIDQAQKKNADCLIVKLDTPGGLLDSTHKIVKKILSSKVPIIVYIFPSGARAGSAGVFITYASHLAAMAPSTNIGAAHPVEFGGKNPLDKGLKKIDQPLKESKDEEKEDVSDDDPMKSKILNDTVAFIKAIAQKRKRNVEWAIKSVTQSDSITETEALEKKVIELIAKDEKDLLDQLDGKTVEIDGNTVTLRTQDAAIRYLNMDFRQKFFNILANPNIAYIFLILGFYGLLYEITHPGFGMPGIVGAILLILSFFSMQLLPTNYAAVALIMLAVGLFIAEASTAGLGFLTAGGLLSMILGSMLLFDSPVPVMRVSMSLMTALSITTAAITIFLVRAILSSHQRKVLSGREELIGEDGVVYSKEVSGKGGKVFVHGEIWNAWADENIKEGEKIKIVEMKGLNMKVIKERSLICRFLLLLGFFYSGF